MWRSFLSVLPEHRKPGHPREHNVQDHQIIKPRKAHLISRLTVPCRFRYSGSSGNSGAGIRRQPDCTFTGFRFHFIFHFVFRFPECRIFLIRAKSSVLSAIIEKQSVDVDTVSGDYEEDDYEQVVH